MKQNCRILPYSTDIIMSQVNKYNVIVVLIAYDAQESQDKRLV